MKLWLITTENKYFVKMLWYLLDKCVKITVLLICLICTFLFFQSSIWALFSYISINYIKSGCIYSILLLFIQHFLLYSAILVSRLFLVLNSSYSISGTVAIVVTVFVGSSVSNFFFIYILLYWHNKFHNIFTIIEVSISYKSK